MIAIHRPPLSDTGIRLRMRISALIEKHPEIVEQSPAGCLLDYPEFEFRDLHITNMVEASLAFESAVRLWKLQHKGKP